MDPFEATKEVAQPQKKLEVWVKIRLVEYLSHATLNGTSVTDDDLLFEARKTIRKCEEHSTFALPDVCWFRDVLMLSGSQPELPMTQSREATWAEKLETISTTRATKSNDLESIHCSKQRAMQIFVESRQSLGLTPTNFELQEKACEILDDAELQSTYPCPAAVNWFKYLVRASTFWLEEVRRKMGLPRTVEMTFENIRSTDNTTIDNTILNYGRLEKELIDFVHSQQAAGLVPTDADLQQQARLIVYGNDDPWNQTLADDPKQLLNFKRLNGLAPRLPEDQNEYHSQVAFQSPSSPKALHWELGTAGILIHTPNSGKGNELGYGNSPRLEPGLDASTDSRMEIPLLGTTMNQPSANSNPIQPTKYFLNDAQCYGRLLRELTRFVKTSMSLNNPNQHVRFSALFQTIR